MTGIDAGLFLRLLIHDQKQTHILFGGPCKIEPKKANILLFQAREGSEGKNI
jgi:hypothetical protein